MYKLNVMDMKYRFQPLKGTHTYIYNVLRGLNVGTMYNACFVHKQLSQGDKIVLSGLLLDNLDQAAYEHSCDLKLQGT